MDRFFDALDLGANITRALRAVRGITGVAALITGVPLALVALLFAGLAWHFDLQPTWQWTAIAVTKLRPTFAGAMADYVPVLIFTLTMLPSLIELFTVRFARYDITLAQWLIYLFVLFDWVTDWPTASDFIDGYVATGVFGRLGLLATPAIYAVKVLWLVFASFGFEMLAIVFAIAALALLLNASRGPQSVAV